MESWPKGINPCSSTGSVWELGQCWWAGEGCRREGSVVGCQLPPGASGHTHPSHTHNTHRGSGGGRVLLGSPTHTTGSPPLCLCFLLGKMG